MKTRSLQVRDLFIWSIAIIFMASFSMLLCPWKSKGAEPVSDIVAIVNGDPISRAELERVKADLLTLKQLQDKTGNRAIHIRNIEQLAMRRLIQRYLILQEAVRRNLEVTDGEFEQALSELRHRFEDLGSFGAWMDERGLDDRSLFKTIRADILANRLLGDLVEGVRLSEGEVLDYYETYKGELKIGEEIRLRLIVVDTRTEAEEILETLRAGQSFAQLAKKRSLGKLAAKGGDTGWIDSRMLPPLLKEATNLLKIGEASKPLQETEDVFYIVAMQGRRPLQAKNLTQARQVIENHLLRQKKQDFVEDWLTEQEKKANIEMYL